MPQHITITEYNPNWPEIFEAEAQLIGAILGENCVAIHHIGSTAVEGLRAKPIIDIMPVVKNVEEVDQTAKEFQKIGYEYLGEFGIAGRRYLRKGGDERTHQIHIFEQSNTKDIQRHLAVRDYLRSHPDAVEEYGSIKAKLAEEFPYDIESYCQSKDEFVKELERKSLSWMKGKLEESV